MSELDRWGDSAAAALLDEVSGAETEEALAMVRNGGSDGRGERPRYALLALAAAAIVVLVAGVALIKSRDTDEVEPPLATPTSSTPATTPATTPAGSTVPATAPTGPATEPSTTVPATEPPVTVPPTTEPPATTAPPTLAEVPPLADQPDFGGASSVAFAGDGVIIVPGSRGDGSPVLWRYAGGWTDIDLPGDNAFAPIAFSDPQTGFAFVDGFVQKTTDGGATWTPVDLTSPAGGGVSVIALAVGAGQVHALAADQSGDMTFRIYTMPLDGSSFTASGVEFPPPAGGEPSASFAFAGDSGWMAVTSRTLMGAAQFSGGQWTAAEVTCLNGGVTYASSGAPGDLVRACDSGFMGSDGSVPEGTQLEVSSDGGATYTPVPILDRSPDTPEFVTLLARPVVGAIVIGAQDGSGVIFDDAGGNGRPLGLPSGSFVSDMATDSKGLWVAVGSTTEGNPAVWVSTDAGATWTG